MPRLTSRGWAVLAASLALFGLGAWAGYPLVRVLAGAGVGTVAAAMVITARRPRGTVTREVYPDRVQRDRPAFARLRVHNPTTRRQSEFTAGDQMGGAFHAVHVRALAPGAEAAYHYELPTGRRGRFQVGPLILQRVDPLGLGRSTLTTGDTTTLWVHPRTHPMRALVGGFPRHHHEGRTTDEPLHGSIDLRDVREYVVGDEVRHLHWKATARTGKLMVRDYVDPNQPRFTALLDNRAELAPAPVLEEAIDVAASMMAASATAGHRCRLVTAGGLDIATRGGTHAVRQFLDALAELEPAEGANLEIAPQSLTRTGERGGCLAVIVAAVRKPDLAALTALRPHYSSTIVVLLANGAKTGVAVRVPGARLLRGTDAEDAVRKWNTVVA